MPYPGHLQENNKRCPRIDTKLLSWKLTICFQSQEEEAGDSIDNETRRKHFYQIEKSLVVSEVYSYSSCPPLGECVVV